MQGLINGAIPGRGFKQPIIKIASAEAEKAAFPAAIFFGNNADIETHKRADIGCDKAIGTNDFHDAPACRQANRHLGNAWVARAGGGINLLAQRHLIGKGNEAHGVTIGIEVTIILPGGGRHCGFCRIQEGQRLPCTTNGGRTDFIGMGKARHLAGYTAQTKARICRIVRRFQAAIIKAKAF